MRATVDNDVLFKGAWYGLLREVLGAVPCAPNDALVLGQSRFVVSKRIEKQAKKLGAASSKVLTHFAEVLAELQLAEPTDAEMVFAAELENAAQKDGLAFDAGESLLASVTLLRGMDRFVTGDKRAIAAVEVLAKADHRLAGMAGRIVCLEQLFVRLLASIDPALLRTAVCGAAHADRALAICFGCSNPAAAANDWTAGLESYIKSIRVTAPTMLHA